MYAHNIPRFFLFSFLTMYVLLAAVFVEFMNAIVFQEKAIQEVLYSQCIFMLLVSLVK